MTTQTPHEPAAHGTGVGGSLSRIKRDGGHTLAELQEFLAQMRGRSPQEVLGMVSASELVRGIVLATIGCVVLIGVFTIIPYALRDDKAAAKSPPSKDAAPAPSDKGAANAAPAVASSGSKTPSDTDLDAAAKALNIDEVKAAPPDVNPLDKDLDKLLDGKE